MPKSRKSYSISRKLRAVAGLEESSVSAVAPDFNISRSMLRAWQGQHEDLLVHNRRERKHGDVIRRRRRVQYNNSLKLPDMEEYLVEWITSQCEEGIGVHVKAITSKARELLRDLYDGQTVVWKHGRVSSLVWLA